MDVPRIEEEYKKYKEIRIADKKNNKKYKFTKVWKNRR